MNSMKFNRIQRGSGVYNCTECGEQTRDTGNGEAEVQMCRACYDINLLNNGASDGSLSQEQYKAGIVEVAKRILAKEKRHNG